MDDNDRNVEDVEMTENRRQSVSDQAKRDELLRKRRRAIKALRDTGMTDEEIERELGVSVHVSNPTYSVDSDGVIDAEVVSVEEDVDAVDDENEPMSRGEEAVSVALVPVRSARRPNGNGSEPTEPAKWSEEWWETVAPGTSYRRCRARSTRHGGQCKQIAMQGTTVCKNHGGLAPQVKLAARARLEMAADRMAANLLRLGTDAESESVRLGATNSALDRVGILKPTEVVLSPGERKPYEDIFVDISSGSRAESRARRGLSSENDVSLGQTPESNSETSGSAGDGGLNVGLNRSANGFDVSHDVSIDDYADNGFDEYADEPYTDTSEFDDKVYTADGRLIGPQPRDFDRREDAPGPRPNASQMNAEDAVAAANRANAQAGALRAIESPHKRYRKP